MDHPNEASVIASLVLSEILALGLHADADKAAIAEFVEAVNNKLDEIASTHDAPAWQLVPADRLIRH